MQHLHIQSHAQTSPEAWELFKFLTLFQTLTFGAGLFAPMMTLHKGLWIFKEETTYSVLEGIQDLAAGGDRWIAVIVFVFSIIFPVLKILLLTWSWLTKKHSHSGRIVAGVAMLGKWSMLDVFVVALLVCLVKVGDLVTVKVRWGLYSFCLSVLLGLCTSWLTTRILGKPAHPELPEPTSP
jgi:paraquat-inducible protein A